MLCHFLGERNKRHVSTWTKLTAGFQVHAVLDRDEPQGKDTREADHRAAQEGEDPRVVGEVSYDVVPR